MPSADDGRDGRDGHRDEKKRRPKEAAEGEASSSGALSADAEAWWNPVGSGRNFLGTCPLLQTLWVSYLHMYIYIYRYPVYTWHLTISYIPSRHSNIVPSVYIILFIVFMCPV